jgi:hypothetical protein
MDSPTSEPSWKRLFAEGGFAWSFRMRPGDVREFFSPQDESGSILTEKRHSLDEHPSRYCATTPAAQPLIDALCGMAASLGLFPPDDPRDLLHFARCVEPDILLMDSATMTLAAGCVCMPSSWSLDHAIGKSMHAVHDVVPRLNPQIGDKIEQFLNKVPQGKAFLRENWSLTRSADLNYHPDLLRPKLDATASPDTVFLRIEHQLFTAIPGGILMGLRIGTCPLTDLAADPDVWRNLTEIIRTMPDDVAGYKSMLAARDPLAGRMRDYPQ